MNKKIDEQKQTNKQEKIQLFLGNWQSSERRKRILSKMWGSDPGIQQDEEDQEGSGPGSRKDPKQRERLQQRRKQLVVLSPRAQTFWVEVVALTCTCMGTTGNSGGLHREMHGEMEQTALTVKLLGFKCPPGEGDLLVTILERGQPSSEVWAAAGWPHLAASSVRVRQQEIRSQIQLGKEPSSSRKEGGTQSVTDRTNHALDSRQNLRQPEFAGRKVQAFWDYILPTLNLWLGCWD